MAYSGRIPRVALVCGVLWLTAVGAWAAELKPTDRPQFRLRARVANVKGQAPDAAAVFTFSLSGFSKTRQVKGGDWCEVFHFDTDGHINNLKLYPNLYMKNQPLVVHLGTQPVVDTTAVEAEIRWVKGGMPAGVEPGVDAAGNAQESLGGEDTPADVALRGELYGPSLGFLVWHDEAGKPRAATMAEYNRQYWKFLDQVQLSPAQRPKKFPIVDRFIGGDNDHLAWDEGISNLAKAGFSALMMPPDPMLRQLLLKNGLQRTAWAVYNPPGYAFDHDKAVTAESIRKWAQDQAKPFAAAGYRPEDMALYAVSDEPGWYFPSVYKPLQENPVALQRFRDYVKAQGLAPADVGCAAWEDVNPIGRSAATDLPRRRLFYWSTRFVAWDSARHFARCTKAMEEAFYPGMPMFSNWNFFSGRYYFPGPFGHNPDKDGPDSAMGSHDWFEFGRLRGTTMLWTEDWFGDDRAWQWSFYCSKLNSAARKGGIEFGGYVIPRCAGGRADGILQKILSIAAHGGKAVKYFVFGPEYNFPGNCYSFNSKVLPKMAEAHGMIGAAEELLWPAKRPPAQVAILQPRSSLPWDAWGVANPTMITDATNVYPDRSTVDYLAEVFDLYLALQHANVPVDWVEEEDLNPQGLAGIRVLYVTEPDLPVEAQQGLLDWIRGGGTLATVAGAATRDRYHEPVVPLREGLDIKEDARERLLVATVSGLNKVAAGTGGPGAFSAVGARSRGSYGNAEVLGTFGDGSPAVVACGLGQGRAVHFAWFPGMSYAVSARTQADGLPAGFSGEMREWALLPVRLAKVRPSVELSVPLVEAPLLLADAGAVITVLNWTGSPVDALSLTLRLPFTPRSVTAVKAGTLTPEPVADGLRLTLPLGAADILLLRR